MNTTACAIDEDALWELVLNGTAGDSNAGLREHVEACAVCSARLEEICRLNLRLGAMHRAPAPAVPETIGTSIGMIQAQQQRTEAEAVTQFLTDTLSTADPYRGTGPTTTTEELLDRMAQRVDEGAFADQPLAEATVRVTIGRTYWALARRDEARRHLLAALDIRERMLGPDHLLVADALHHLARVADGVRSPNRRAVLERALAIRQAQLGDDHPDTLRTQFRLAVRLRDHGDPAAEPIFRHVLETQRRVLGEDHLDVAATC